MVSSPLSDCPPATAARAVLRAATRDLHDAAERTPVMKALFSGRLDAQRYRGLLYALHDYFCGWEHAHAASLATAEAHGWAWGSRAALLALDLADAMAVPALVAPVSVPPPASAAHGWGALYVIEGSTLGARLLAAKLRAAFPGSTALRYFSLGDGEPQRWRQFERVLEHALADPASHAGAIAGARATFTGFTAALVRSPLDVSA